MHQHRLGSLKLAQQEVLLGHSHLPVRLLHTERHLAGVLVLVTQRRPQVLIPELADVLLTTSAASCKRGSHVVHHSTDMLLCPQVVGKPEPGRNERPVT